MLDVTPACGTLSISLCLGTQTPLWNKFADLNPAIECNRYDIYPPSCANIPFLRHSTAFYINAVQAPLSTPAKLTLIVLVVRSFNRTESPLVIAHPIISRRGIAALINTLNISKRNMKTVRPNRCWVSVIVVLSVLFLAGFFCRTHALSTEPLPGSLQGNFSSDGAMLTLPLSEHHFHHWHSEAQRTTTPTCDDLFIGARELLGPLAVCHLRGRVVEISLGPAATIQPTAPSLPSTPFTSSYPCRPGPTYPLIFRELKSQRQLQVNPGADTDTGFWVFGTHPWSH